MNEAIQNAAANDKDKGVRKVVLIREKARDYPDLYLGVFFKGENPREEALFRELFVKAGCYSASSPDQADFVVFGGGVDVNPALYGEDKHPNTFYNDTRDEEDLALFQECYDKGIPMVGICRGAQLIHVAMGGKLWQDVNNHQGDHHIWLTQEKRSLSTISSVHHQMVMRQDGMEVLADSSKATVKWKNSTEKVEGNEMDVEAYFYREICALGFQGHPEYRGYGEYAAWFLSCIENYISHCPDLHSVKGVYRIKPEILEERAAKKTKELM